MLWSKCGPGRRESRGESISSENFQVSPDFLRAAEYVARDEPNHRRGALNG